MSQRAVLRGFFLCILTVLTAVPVFAQSQAGSITFSPANPTFAVGEAAAVTAHVVFPVGAAVTGPQTLSFQYLPYGVTTQPDPVTFSAGTGQTSADVTFTLVAAPFAYPSTYGMLVSSTPAFATGPLNLTIEPVSIQPGTVQVIAGTTSEPITATIAFSGDVPPVGTQQLTFAGLPDGATPNPSPVTYTIGLRQQPYGQVSFQIDVDAATTPGVYDVTVGSEPALTGTRTFTLVVAPSGGMNVTLGKPTVDLCPGGAAVPSSVTVSPYGGYLGSPTVTFPGLPLDLVVEPPTIVLPPLPPAQGASFTISARSWSAPGTRDVTVRVADEFGTSAVSTFRVNVVTDGFTAGVDVSTVSLEAGGPSSPVSVEIAPIACGTPPASVTVTPSGLPPGVTADPPSVVLTGPPYAQPTFQLSASSAAPAGSGLATFTFTPSAGAARTIQLPVTVARSGRISVVPERPSMDVCPGGAAVTNTLLVSGLDGYSGSPTISFSSLAAGLTVAPSVIPVPQTPPARTVAFTVAADAGLAPGPRTVTVLATDPRGLSTTTSFVANVLPPAFDPKVAPTAVVLNAAGVGAMISASILTGSCPPSAGVKVTPSGLPPGVTISPASEILAPPNFDPIPFSLVASSSAAPGPTTITFTFAATGGVSKTTTATVTVCGPPAAPASPVIQPQGSASGPVTATDFLSLAWNAPAAGFDPTHYEWRLNGGEWTPTTLTSASAPPRGTLDPVQLFVRGYACAPERGPGPEGASPVYALAAPVASFSVPSSVVAGQAATFTDTSSPQATSWLWLPGDGMPATTVQSPTVTFPSAGPRTVVLVATNGSGSSSKSATVNVLPASSVRAEASFAVRGLDRQPDGRFALDRVDVEAGTTLVLRRLGSDGEAVAWLRLLDGDGRVAVERRLVVAAGEAARHDLSAFASGPFRVEVVGPADLEAVVEERAIRLGGPEIPVIPRRGRVP